MYPSTMAGNRKDHGAYETCNEDRRPAESQRSKEVRKGRIYNEEEEVRTRADRRAVGDNQSNQ